DGDEKDFNGCSGDCLKTESCFTGSSCSNNDDCLAAYGLEYKCVSDGAEVPTNNCAVYWQCPANQDAYTKETHPSSCDGESDFCCGCGLGDTNADGAADQNYAIEAGRNCQSNQQCPQGTCVNGSCSNCTDVDECSGTSASVDSGDCSCAPGETSCESPSCTRRDGTPGVGLCIDTDDADSSPESCSLGLDGDPCNSDNGNGDCVGLCRNYNTADDECSDTSYSTEADCEAASETWIEHEKCYTCGDDNPPSWRDGSGSAGECVNLAGSYSCAVDSDEDGFEGALPSCGYTNFYGENAVTFHCEPDAANPGTCLPQTILLYDAPINTEAENPSQMWGAKEVRKTACNDMLIDGTNRNITIEMSDSETKTFHDPTLYPEGACKAFAEGLGGEYVTSHGCTEVEDGAGFLRLKGTGNTIRNLAVSHFFEGVQITGSFNTIENMTFDGLCDDAMTSGFKTDAGRGIGNRIIGSVFKNGCDKCTQFYGGDLDFLSPTGGGTATCPAPVEWSVEYDGVQWVDCAKPMRATAGGRVSIRNSVVTTTGTEGHGGCLVSALSGGSTEFVQGESGGPFVIEFDNTKIAGCTIGLQLGGAVNAVLKNTTVSSNEQVGILLRKDAQLVLKNRNQIIFNGGVAPPSGKKGYGGVAVDPGGSYSPRAVLGGDSIDLPVFTGFPSEQEEEAGENNKICDNRNHKNDPKALQIDNKYGGDPIYAQGVDWCGKTPAVDGPAITD
ncbi:MAG: hypothetical protein VCB80_04375, partial [Deltaproteobacteria bacterium]